MKIQKLNPEKEFNDIMNKITRGFMLDRCKLYKVRHRKNEDTLPVLCFKYLNKLEKMEPWDIPDDEFGNTGWLNPDRILEDEAIRLILARSANHPAEKLFEKKVKALIKNYIKQVEFIENVKAVKRNLKKSKKKSGG